MTIIKLVCWWRENSVLFFDLMDVYEQESVLVVSKINYDKNNIFAHLICVTFGLITSVSTYVPIKCRLLNKPIKLLYFPRIFHSTNGFNPEIAVRRIAGNVMSFCQRTVTPGKPAEIVCWLCTVYRNVYRHFNSIIPVNSPEQFEDRIPECTSCLCLRPHVPPLTSSLSNRCPRNYLKICKLTFCIYLLTDLSAVSSYG